MAPKPLNDGSTRTPGSGNFQGVSPVLLSSSCDVLQSNAAIPDSGLLTYPFRKAIVLEEIRWDLRQIVADPTGKQRQLGALVSTKLQLGRHLLMRDGVPIWLLGTTMAHSQEEATDSTLDAASNCCLSHYRWRLPKPLYIEAGQVLSSVFSRGADGFSSINVQVTYVGKTVAPNQPIPSRIAIPYAASFLSTVGNVYQQSNENHLINPFDTPIQIQRLTGRVLSFASGVTATQLKVLTPVPASLTTVATILMNDSWGGKMVNNNTGISDVFDSQRAAWTVDTVMPPKGVYEARIWNIPANQSIHIAMVGYRNEAL